MGPFLDGKLLNPCGEKIIDAAGGIGCEAVYYAKRGVDIIYNEIDPELRRVAQARVAEVNVSLNIRTHDWRCFAEEYGPSRYDGVFVLGNSLALLLDVVDRRSAIKNFYDILRPGGRLIIDERNFRYIMDDAVRIIEDREFHYSGEVVYCGTTVEGRPVEVNDDNVIFGYFNQAASGKLVGSLKMYTFKAGELWSELERAGFSSIERYSDLRAGYDCTADFFTYVAEK